MAQKGFPKNPDVGDTFKKDDKTYVFQGDRWVIKDDFSGPNPGTEDGQEWTNIRTDQTYVWDAANETWEPKVVSPSSTAAPSGTTTTTAAPTTTTTTAPSRGATTTTAAPKKAKEKATILIAVSNGKKYYITPTQAANIARANRNRTDAEGRSGFGATREQAGDSTPPITEGIPGDPFTNAPVDYQAEYKSAQNYAYGLLTRQTRVQRIEFLNLLYAKGFGGTTKPTTGGLEDSDVDIATQFYLYYSGNTKSTSNPNGQYITVEDAYQDIKTWKTTTTAGAGKFTPKLDVSSAFRQVMQNDLGRAPTDQELERFYTAYRGLESGENAPNVQSAAESQIEKTMSAESEASAFSGYADVFEQLMRGA